MQTIWHEIDAPAKLNLCLQVLGKRSDGYHELLSFAGFTDFGDRVFVRLWDRDRIELFGPFADALRAAGGDRLCSKALELLRAAGFNLPPLYIRLEKNIPLGGGLGGGSTDAAALLRLISKELLAGQIPADILMNIAGQIGADVPVCLYPGWQIMTGAGTICRPVSFKGALPHLNGPIYCVLANPNLHLSTAHIFSALTRYSPSALARLEAKIEQAALGHIISIGNDLMEPVLKEYSDMAWLIKFLKTPHLGFIGASMSGSGASCFALTQNKEQADQLTAELLAQNIWAQSTKMRL